MFLSTLIFNTILIASPLREIILGTVGALCGTTIWGGYCFATYLKLRDSQFYHGVDKKCRSGTCAGERFHKVDCDKPEYVTLRVINGNHYADRGTMSIVGDLQELGIPTVLEQHYGLQ